MTSKIRSVWYCRPVSQPGNFKQNYKQNKMVLKIEEVKDCIGFDRSNGIGETLELMVDLWYKKALSEGLSDREAVMIAFDNLSNKITEMAKTIQ